MKASVRLGLLGMFVVLAAAFGVAQTSGVAQAQTTKTCTRDAISGVTTCTLAFAPAAAAVTGNTITTNAGTFTGATLTATGGLTAVAAGTTITLTCPAVAPATCTLSSVTETLTGLAVGALVAQTATGALGAIPAAQVAAAALTAAQIPAAIAAGLITKTCSATTVDVSNPITCTITLTVPVGVATIPIVVSGPAGLTVTAAVAGLGVTSAVAGTTITVTCPAGTCPAGTMITETLTSTTAGAVTETIAGAPIAVLGGVAFVGLGPTGASKVCAPTLPDGVPNPATDVRVGQSLTCVVTVTFPAGTTVTPVPATVTLTNATFSAGVNPKTFTCNPVPGTQTCTFTEDIAPTVACVTITQTIVISGTTLSPAVVNAAGAPIRVLGKIGSGVECPGIVLPLKQPDNLVFVCDTIAGLFGDPVLGLPGTIVASSPFAGIGVLPGIVTCKVFPVIGGAHAAVAPGKIEISSIDGTLIDAGGRLSTNLRIECGDISGVFVTPDRSGILPAIDKNSCLGVAFAVAGNGVGIVEINARFEPATFAVADGIQEVEAKAQIGFIAPLVTVSLALSPNPVAVGQTGTATARFNRTFNCALTFGVASIAGGTACIDPTTGAPIVFNLGSALNGNVVFTIDNSLVASWASAQPTATAPVPSSTAGFVATANQLVTRCGFFPTAGVPFTSISQFFGGCETTSATYRGNAPGAATVAATFVPDLPGAFGNNVQLSANVAALLGLFSGANPTSTRVLEVTSAVPSGAVQLAKGCNNVSPTVSETATAYAARVSPAAALVAIWEHQAATNTFKGFSPMAGAPNDLASVTRLKPVFVCVSAAATLDQPAA